MTEGVPWWVLVLDIAHQWGVPPWVVAGMKDEQMVWMERQRLWMDAQGRRQRMEMKHGE